MTVRMDAIERSVSDVAVVEDPDGSPLMLHRRHIGPSVRRDTPLIARQPGLAGRC